MRLGECPRGTPTPSDARPGSTANLAILAGIAKGAGVAKALIDRVKLGKRGELVLPRRVRSALGLREGDDLLVTVDDRRLIVERRGRALGTYLDAMADDGGEPAEGPPGEEAPVPRGLARFLVR